MLTCYDTGFPEVSRGLALAGAHFLCVPSALAKARLHAWDLGTDSVYAGHSRLVAAERRVIPYLRDLRPEFLAAYEGCLLCRR